LPIRLDYQDVAFIKPVVELPEAVGSGLALDPQHPVITKRQFEVMASLVSAADFPSADELGYRKFNANALPTRTEPAHVAISVGAGSAAGLQLVAISVAGAASVRLKNFKLAPLWHSMTASVHVTTVTARPRRSQISPVWS
jgi:hypothetical protein